ncbi:hypothetical protein ACSTEF_21360 [Vibrio vulnificus]|uniref:hypothetical protein n=1 Tax=Vibrio vulnificus TaxID=672 RepID=UPI003ED8C92B
MDFETAKTVAAFGGLGLGAINLGLTVYKDFLKKPRLDLEVESARICCRSIGEFDFQITFSLKASRGDVYLKEIELCHKEKVFGEYDPSNKLVMNRLSPHMRVNLLDLTSDEYKEKVTKLSETAELVRDLEVSEGQRRTFTITDRFYSENIMGDRQEVPKNNWNLRVDFGVKTETVAFDFTPQGANLNEFREKYA